MTAAARDLSPLSHGDKRESNMLWIYLNSLKDCVFKKHTVTAAADCRETVVAKSLSELLGRVSNRYKTDEWTEAPTDPVWTNQSEPRASMFVLGVCFDVKLLH